MYDYSQFSLKDFKKIARQLDLFDAPTDENTDDSDRRA